MIHESHRLRLIAHSVFWIGGSTLGTAIALARYPPTHFDMGLLGLTFVLSGIGISVGFHRYLAHRSFEATPPLQYLLLFLGNTAAQGPPVYWAILHRNHHRHSDLHGDPHSPVYSFERRPVRGFLHAHFGWIGAVGMPRPERTYADLFRDRAVRIMNTIYGLTALCGVLAPGLIAWLYYDRSADGFARGALWGGAVRLFLVHHVVWSINSVCHVWGRQRYVTGDASRNNWLLALPSFGEAWHNNHHVAAGSARFGHYWWEIDLGYLAIRLFLRLGLAKRAHVVPLAAVRSKLIG